jgi:hypothetical protein
MNNTQPVLLDPSTLARVTGGAGGSCQMFNFGGPATVTPQGGSPVAVSGGGSVFPSATSVPAGRFGLNVGDTTFRDKAGSTTPFACHGQNMVLVPGPTQPGLFNGH